MTPTYLNGSPNSLLFSPPTLSRTLTPSRTISPTKMFPHFLILTPTAHPHYPSFILSIFPPLHISLNSHVPVPQPPYFGASTVKITWLEVWSAEPGQFFLWVRFFRKKTHEYIFYLSLLCGWSPPSIHCRQANDCSYARCPWFIWCTLCSAMCFDGPSMQSLLTTYITLLALWYSHPRSIPAFLHFF